MSGIFISYRREDSAGYAGRLYDRLNSRFGEGRVFMDVSAIEAGEDFTQAIDRNLASCKVLLALLGKQWLSLTDAAGRRRLDDPGDFVRIEVATGLKRDVRVIPLLVQGAKMPSEQALPSGLEPLAKRNAVSITDANFHRDVDGLIRAMEGIFETEGEPAARPVVGQVIVGNPGGQYNLHIGSAHGGVIHNVPAEEAARLEPRPTPILVRPRPFPGMLDREQELMTAEKALRDGLPVQFYGAEGAGKTSILRRLAHAPESGAFPDGLLFLSGRGKPEQDLTQELFEAFFQVSPLYKPSDTEIRQSLQNTKALILVDDAEVAKEELEDLLNTAPGCAFLTAGPARTLWGEGRAIALKGLPEDIAVTLLEREMGRPLSAEERSAAAGVCRSVEGNPFQILQAAAKASDEGLPAAAAASPPGERAIEAAVAERPPEQRRLLGALAAFGGAPASAQHLAAITGYNDASAGLEALSRSGLVRPEGDRYRPVGDLLSVLRKTSDFVVSVDRALAYFSDWAERSGEEPERIQAESDSVSGLLEEAAATGQWEKALRLGRAVEGALALSKKWGSWEKILRKLLDASRSLQDKAGEARASHQLGTCRLCLGDAALAKQYLGHAADLREAIGDSEGAALSRHNLEQLAPVTPPVQEEAAKARHGSKLATGLLLKGVAAVSLLAVPAAVYYVKDHRRKPLPIEKSAPVPVPAPLPTAITPAQPPPAERREPPPAALPKPVAEEAVQPVAPEAPPPPAPATPETVVHQPVAPAPPPAPEAIWVRPSRLAFSSLSVNTESSGQSAVGTGGISFRRRRRVETEERRIRLFNQTTAPVKIAGVSISGPQSGDFTKTEDSCSNSEVAPDANCSVSISFAPAAAGPRNAVLKIEYTGPGSPKVVDLSGAGTPSNPE